MPRPIMTSPLPLFGDIESQNAPIHQQKFSVFLGCLKTEQEQVYLQCPFHHQVIKKEHDLMDLWRTLGRLGP